MPKFTLDMGGGALERKLAEKLSEASGVNVEPSGVVWLNLTSRDPRKPAAVAALRRAAGVATSRVTLCKVSKDGKLAKGRVLATRSEHVVPLK